MQGAAQARALYDLGVTDAAPERIEASLQLSEVVLVDVGVPMGPVIASVHEKRDEHRTLLHAPAGSGERQAIRKRSRFGGEEAAEIRSRRGATREKGFGDGGIQSSW